MKDMQAMLRRLDEEIIGHQQQIAMHQVEMVRAQDARRLLMGLAEADHDAAQSAAMQRQGVIPGAHSKPMLIVRKVGSGEPEMSSERTERELGIVEGGKRKGLPRLRPARKGTKAVLTDLRERILKVVTPGEEPMGPREIGNNIGLSTKEQDRKPMWNALYQMKLKGVLQRDAEGRYYRPMPNGNGH